MKDGDNLILTVASRLIINHEFSKNDVMKKFYVRMVVMTFVHPWIQPISATHGCTKWLSTDTSKKPYLRNRIQVFTQSKYNVVHGLQNIIGKN